MATRDDIDEAIKQCLLTGTSKNGNLIDPPTDQTLPYWVLLPMNIGAGGGGFNDPEEEHDFLYNIINVGKSARQAAAMSSLTFTVMTAIVGSSYVHPITITGNSVMWRRSDGRGAIIRTGETLFQSTDSYRIRVGP